MLLPNSAARMQVPAAVFVVCLLSRAERTQVLSAYSCASSYMARRLAPFDGDTPFQLGYAWQSSWIPMIS